VAIHRWLLRLCPPEVRREYGAAIEEMYARRMSDARTAGRWRLVQAWRREATSLVIFAISERHRRHQAARRRADRMDTLWQETRLAARRLLRAPAFAAAAAATLALAIGANAAIFAVVQRVVLNPLPYPESDRVIALQYGVPSSNAATTTAMPLGFYYQFADRARTIESIAVYRADERTLTGDGEPLRASVVHTTASLASVLRVRPALGRWFRDDEGIPGAAPVAVLSHGLWMRRYGGNPAIVGRSVTVNGVPTTIVGVMAQTFAFPPQPRGVDLWVADQVARSGALGLFTHAGIARLRDGVTAAEARAELTRLIAELPQAYPGDRSAFVIATQVKLTSTALPLKERMVGNVARALWTLLAAVGLVLLVAAANVANLFLVRSETRQREIAVRRALGAGRWGIARYFFTESLLLSAAGGTAGLLLAFGATRLLVANGPATLPRLSEIRLDGVVVAFTLVLTALTGLAFGIIPLLRRTPTSSALHDTGRGNTPSRRRHHVRQLLMGGQVALALIVLIASGLMVRSFQQLRSVDPGFDPAATLVFRLGLPVTEYPTRAADAAAHQAILDRLSTLPGVAAASASTSLPLLGQTWSNAIRIDDGKPAPAGRLPPLVEYHAVAGGFVEAMGMRLLKGRTITRTDVDRGEPMVVVNQALVDAYLPDRDAVGLRLSSSGRTPRWLTIAGVVANTPSSALNEPSARPKLYMPMSIAGGPDIRAQTGDLVGPSPADMYFVMRTTAGTAMLPQARAAIDAIDPKLAMSQVMTLDEVVDRSSAQMAFTMVLLAIAAAVALLLGIVGVYGVMSYIVTQRTGEIGVRLALGAAPRGVAAMIVRQGGIVALAGVVIGLAGALAGGRFIESLLYGVSPRDPVVFATTTLALLAVAWGACWLPARRASKLSPIEALRPE